MNEVDSAEKRQCEEDKATQELESGRRGAVSVKKLLQKLSRPNESALFYAGGIQLLTDTIQDCKYSPFSPDASNNSFATCG